MNPTFPALTELGESFSLNPLAFWWFKGGDPDEKDNLADSDSDLLEEMMDLIRELSVKNQAFLGGVKQKQNVQ